MNQINGMATFLANFQQQFETMYMLIIVMVCLLTMMFILVLSILFQNMGLKERIIRLEGYNDGRTVERT